MTMLQTMGTSSCATIAIAWFKGDNKERNEQYKANPSRELGEALMQPSSNGVGTVKDFKDKVLLPISQPLGRTNDYPFQFLMDEIDNQPDLKDQFIIATLNGHQYHGDDGYWRKELERNGFKLFDKTKNRIMDSICYIYVRSNNRCE